MNTAMKLIHPASTERGSEKQRRRHPPPWRTRRRSLRRRPAAGMGSSFEFVRFQVWFGPHFIQSDWIGKWITWTNLPKWGSSLIKNHQVTKHDKWTLSTIAGAWPPCCSTCTAWRTWTTRRPPPSGRSPSRWRRPGREEAVRIEG